MDELDRLAQEAEKNGDYTDVETPEAPTDEQVFQAREKEGNEIMEGIQGPIDAKEKAEGRGAQMVIGAGLDVIESGINGIHDTLDWGEGLLKDLGYGDGDILTPGKAVDFANKIIPPSDNPMDNVVRGVLKYVIPYAGVSRLVKGGSAVIKASKSLGYSAVLNGMLIDPKEKHVADFANEVPMLAPYVPAWLMSEEDDTAFESRVKNMVESVIVDTPLAGIEIGLAVAKSFNMARKARKYRAAKRGGDVPPPGAGTHESVNMNGEKVGADVPPGATGEGAEQAGKQNAKQGTKEGAEEGAEQASKQKKTRTPEDEEALKNAFEPQTFTPEDLKVLKGARTLEEMEAAFLKTSKHAEIKKITALTKRGKIPNDETTLRAVGIMMDKKKFKNVLDRSLQQGVTLNAEEVRAMDIYARSKVSEAADFLDNVKNFDGEDFNLQMTVLKMQEAQVVMMGRKATFSEIARSLQIGKVTDSVNISDLRMEYLNKYVKVVGEDNVINMVKEMEKIRKLKQPADLVEAITRLGEGRIDRMSRKFQGYYLSNLISGLGTTKMALVGNSSYGAVRAGELAIQGMISPFIKGASVGEVSAAYRAVPTAVIEAITNTKDFVLHNKLPKDIRGQRFTDTERVFTKFMQKHNLSGKEGSGWNKAVNSIGNLVTSGQGRLQAIDAFSGTTARRTVQNQLAYREVYESGLKEGTPEFAQALVKNTASPTDEMLAEVYGSGRRAGFAGRGSEVPIIGGKDKNLGAALDYMSKGLSRIPIVNVTVPFIRTATNLADFSIQRIPGLNLLHPKVKAGFKAGGAARAEAMSKTIMGTTILSAGALLTFQGHMTGSNAASRNFKKKLTGDGRYGEYLLNVPWSDKPIKYDRLDPMGSILSISADLAEIAGYYMDGNSIEFEELVGAASILVKDLMIPEGPVRNFGDLFKFLTDMSINKIPLSLTGLIPQGGLVKEITKTGPFAIDPTKRDTSTETRKENKRIASGVIKAWDEVWNKALDQLGVGGGIKGFIDRSPPLLNVLGDETAYPPGVKVEHALPYFRHDLTNENMSPVYKELYRLAPTEFTDAAAPFRELLAMPDRVVDYGMHVPTSGITSKVKEGVFKYELNPEQYHKLVKLSAGIGLGGPTLKENLAKLFKTNAYKDQKTDLARKAMIYQMGVEFRGEAKKKFMMEIEGVEEEMKRMGRKFQMSVQGKKDKAKPKMQGR